MPRSPRRRAPRSPGPSAAAPRPEPRFPPPELAAARPPAAARATAAEPGTPPAARVGPCLFCFRFRGPPLHSPPPRTTEPRFLCSGASWNPGTEPPSGSHALVDKVRPLSFTKNFHHPGDCTCSTHCAGPHQLAPHPGVTR
ncbi:uncharacterized protein [Equus asinus]|uniref:uncharacterized protein n=1 Tax=Equus asinus TaxID=9793 RepID=UPI001D051F23|nr:atherin-like [Equus asinus]